MTKKLPKILVVVVSLVALFATTAISRTKLANYADKTRGYSFNTNNLERMTREMLTPEMENENFSQSGVTRSSLGSVASSSAVSSPGVTVDNTYDDWQWSHNRRRVEFRGRPDIQFVYTDQKLKVIDGTDDVVGYNVYTPLSGGNWPQGLEVGCQLNPQDATERGVYPNLDVNPEGFVFIGSHTTISPGSIPLDNTFLLPGKHF